MRADARRVKPELRERPGMTPELARGSGVTLRAMVDHADLRIDVYRSRDADGATERAVRVTHIPTGLVGVSQGEESQAEDVAAAIAEIEAKLSAPSDPV